jgi:hypothetical protein
MVEWTYHSFVLRQSIRISWLDTFIQCRCSPQDINDIIPYTVIVWEQWKTKNWLAFFLQIVNNVRTLGKIII